MFCKSTIYLYKFKRQQGIIQAPSTPDGVALLGRDLFVTGMRGVTLERQVPIASGDYLRESWGEVFVECAVVLEFSYNLVSN